MHYPSCQEHFLDAAIVLQAVCWADVGKQIHLILSSLMHYQTQQQQPLTNGNYLLSGEQVRMVKQEEVRHLGVHQMMVGAKARQHSSFGAREVQHSWRTRNVVHQFFFKSAHLVCLRILKHIARIHQRSGIGLCMTYSRRIQDQAQKLVN